MIMWRLPYDLPLNDNPPNRVLTLIGIVTVLGVIVAVARAPKLGQYAGGTVLLAFAMIGLTLADASRLGLAVVCVVSAVTAGMMTTIVPPQFRWNLVFTAVWSLVFAAGMWSLATGYRPLSGALIAALNWSAAATVGGWAVLAGRMVYHSRKGS